MTPTTTPPADHLTTVATPPTPTGPVPVHDPNSPDPPPAHLRVVTEELAERWAGKHVAWSWDGSTILAGADTIEELGNLLDRAGINVSRVVFSYVDEPGATYF